MSYKKRILMICLPILLVVAIACAGVCSALQSRDYIDGNVLNLAYIDDRTAQEGRIVSPWKNQGIYSTLMFRALFLADANFESVTCDLAESYEILDDGSTYRITLKDNLFWSDGEPITMDDVVFSIETCLITNDVNSIFTTAFNKISGIEAYMADPSVGLSGLEQDGNTLLIHLDTRHQSMIQILAQLSILPKHVLENEDFDSLNDNDFWGTPVVNGMYQIGSFIPDECFILVRNEYYEDTPPKIDEIHLLFDFETVNLDYYSTNTITDMISYRAMKGIEEYDVNMLFYRYFIFNITGVDGKENEAMQDERVRQAIAYAIDVESVFYDIYFQAGTLLDSGVPDDDMPTTLLGYNPDTARALLEEAEYDFDRPLRITYYYTDETSVYFLERVARDLEAVGFTVELIYASNGSADLFDTREYDIALKGLASFDVTEWYNEYHSDQSTFPYIWGDAGEFDSLIDVLTTEVNEVVYDAALDKLEVLEQELIYKLPLFSLKQALYINESRVSVPSDITFGNTWYRYDIDFEEWEIKREPLF